jgi:hypothetical protein
MTMALVRNPKPAPPVRRGTQAIVTHSQPAAGSAKGGVAREASSLHGRLYAAFQASDWPRLIAVARGHLDALAAGAALHPISAEAVAFLQPKRIAATDYDLKTFCAGFETKAIKDYMAGGFAHDWAALADEALALHCLDALGKAKSDPTGKLRSLNALSALITRFNRATKEREPSFTHIVEQAYEAPVFLPDWSFEIDVCSDPHPRDGLLALTPLELRWRRILQMREKATGNCDCTPPEPVCTPQSVCCPEFKYYIADLLELRDWTYRYKAGDIAYIEVVGAGEMRKREHIMKVTKEVFSELTSTNRISDKRDLSVTDIGTLSREIDRANTSKQDGTATVAGSYGTDKSLYKLSATATLSYGTTASDAIKEAQSDVRTTVSSAVAEIEKTVTAHSTDRVTTEETETNSHDWDNIAGVDPKVTKYFWVTQEKRAQLYSHGLRLIAELIIPSPARLFERLVADRLEAEVRKQVPPLVGTAPVAPSALALTANDLTRENYLQNAAQYGINNAPAPPTAVVYEVVSNAYGKVGNKTENKGTMQVSVPAGYHATHMHLDGGASYRTVGTGNGRYVKFALGTELWFGSGGNKLDDGLPNLTGQLAITVSASNITGCTASITVTCNLDNATFAAWQKDIFDLISSKHDDQMSAYQAALKTWLDAKAEHDAAEAKVREELQAQDDNRNPFYNRQIERTELKRAAIYLLCEDFSCVSEWIAKAEPCGLPEIDRHQTAEHGYDWYFWDRLFDWQYMAYAFFDYFWNPMCDWVERFDPDNADAIFKAFLGAGYARVLIPVNLSMEADFLWYSSTLQKWGQTGVPPLNPTDPRWQNVLYELKYANKDAMMPRQGYVENVAAGDVTLLIKGTDRYWDSVGHIVDAAAVAADVDREIFIDGSVYMIASIQPEPGSPPYTNANTMWWRVTIDRPYEGSASARRLYACGAQAVAPAFSFDLPTELIWAGAHDQCLPTYPLPPCTH